MFKKQLQHIQIHIKSSVILLSIVSRNLKRKRKKNSNIKRDKKDQIKSYNNALLPRNFENFMNSSGVHEQRGLTISLVDGLLFQKHRSYRGANIITLAQRQNLPMLV